MHQDIGDMGPVDYLIVEFPGSRMTGEGLPLLVDLVEGGVIRILDLVFIHKGTDGSVDLVELRNVGDEVDLTVFEGASSGLLDQGDLDDAGAALEAGNSAAVVVYENVWAAPWPVRCGAAGPRWWPVGASPWPRCWRRWRPPRRRRRPRGTDAAIAAPHHSVPHRPAPHHPRITGEMSDMPGLLRGVARTAVVAGTATAVSNRVSRRQAGRWAQQDPERQVAYQQDVAPTPAAPAPAGPPSAADEMTSKIDQLKQLGDLKAQGVLTDEEFAAQKRQVLG